VKSIKFAALAATAAATALVLSACGGQSTEPTGDALSGAVVIDGSSTVAPLTEAAADLYRDVEAGVNVTVATSGTGGGFEKFCAGETDLSNASRGIKDEEAALCAENGIEFTEIIVANDGLAVVVPAGNDFVQCLTVEQLNTIWGPEAEGTITSHGTRLTHRSPMLSSLSSDPEPTRERSTTSPRRSTVKKAQSAPTTAPRKTTTFSSRESLALKAASASSVSPT
jgi:hypothetical protein